MVVMMVMVMIVKVIITKHSDNKCFDECMNENLRPRRACKYYQVYRNEIRKLFTTECVICQSTNTLFSRRQLNPRTLGS